MKTEGKIAEEPIDEGTRPGRDAAGQDQAELAAMVSMEAAVAASREFVHRFWNADTAGCVAMLSPDFSWVGVEADDFGGGAETFAQMHGRMAGPDVRVILMGEEYRAIPSGGTRTVVVACQYRCFTGLSFTSTSSLRQRVTFVWRARPEGLRLVHCHLSQPVSGQDADAQPAAQAPSFSADRYAMTLLRDGADEPVEIRDVDGGVHFIRPTDVLYLEARRQSTVVHCVSGQFRLREGIGRVVERVDPKATGLFVFTHRSFSVNSMYVTCVGRDTVEMSNGDVLSLSVRRRDEVLEQIGRVQKAC